MTPIAKKPVLGRARPQIEEEAAEEALGLVAEIAVAAVIH
jgi:hypothetical protein